MNNGYENTFDLNSLYIVKLKDNTMDNYFEDIYYIVEKYEEKNQQGFYEIYTECITDKDIYERNNKEEFKTIPDVFSMVREFPRNFCNKEELETGKIKTHRLFYLFQQLNYLQFIKQEAIKENKMNSKTLTLGSK